MRQAPKIGTVVRIVAWVTVHHQVMPDFVRITIYDSEGNKRVEQKEMVYEENMWAYNFQSTSADSLGPYTVEVTAGSGIYQSVNSVQFWFGG